MEEAGDDEEDRRTPEPQLGSPSHLHEAQQNQEEGRIFDEIGVRPHSRRDDALAAVADRDLVEAPHLADPESQPDIEQSGGARDGEGYRHGHWRRTQNGRASCRESVCQTVWIWGGAEG